MSFPHTKYTLAGNLESKTLHVTVDQFPVCFLLLFLSLFNFRGGSGLGTRFVSLSVKHDFQVMVKEVQEDQPTMASLNQQSFLTTSPAVSSEFFASRKNYFDFFFFFFWGGGGGGRVGEFSRCFTIPAQ